MRFCLDLVPYIYYLLELISFLSYSNGRFRGPISLYISLNGVNNPCLVMLTISIMTLSGVLPENTKPRLRAALTRAPSSWKQTHTSVKDTHTLAVHCCYKITCNFNLTFTWRKMFILVNNTDSPSYIFTMTAGVWSSGGVVSDAKPYMRMLQARKSSLLVFYSSLNCPSLFSQSSLCFKSHKTMIVLGNQAKSHPSHQKHKVR